MRRRVVAATLALSLFGAACSSEPKPGTTPADDPKAGRDKVAQGDGPGGGKGQKGDGKTGAEKGRENGERKKDDNIGVPDSDTPAPAEADEDFQLESQGPGGPAFATKSASFDEATPDAKKEGPLTPRYAEATALDVEGLGKTLRLTFTFDGEVPQKMPTEQTYMIVSFSLSSEDEDEKGYGINAQASSRGWQVAMGSKAEATRFPGTFFVRGNTVEFTLPWSAVGGPRPFQFYASASWFQFAGTTNYSADPIPNEKAVFPN